MAVYRNISLSFWTDRKVEDEFTPEDKYMYLYLLTNPYTNICGCYEISIKQMSRQTGYNEESISRIISRLEYVHDVIRYSNDTQEVLILRWAKYNWTRSEKLRKPIQKTIENIKQASFREYVGQLLDTRDDTVSIPYPYPMDTTVTVTVTDTVSVTDTVPKKITRNRDAEFDAFWAQYPKKESKAAARKAWNKIKASEVQEIMDSLGQHKASAQWQREDGRFIPYAATWLNNRRWEDELEPLPGPSPAEIIL